MAEILITWAPSSEFVSSSIPSWQIVTAHAQPFRGARDLAFCLKVPLDSLLVWASSEGSGETARMCRLACTFAARIGDKYQIRLTRSTCTWSGTSQKYVAVTANYLVSTGRNTTNSRSYWLFMPWCNPKLYQNWHQLRNFSFDWQIHPAIQQI